MPMTRTFTASLFAATLVFGAPASADLQDETKINNGLLAVGLALEISDSCASISRRNLQGFAFLNSLKRQANSLGYSNDEITRYIRSDVEKAKMRKRGKTYLAQNGASTSDPASMCRVGRAEIKKRSQIGVLLRAR